MFFCSRENPWDFLGFSWGLMRISWCLVEFSGFNRIFQCDLMVFWGFMMFFSGISISNSYYYADTGFYHPKKTAEREHILLKIVVNLSFFFWRGDSIPNVTGLSPPFIFRLWLTPGGAPPQFLEPSWLTGYRVDGQHSWFSCRFSQRNQTSKTIRETLISGAT